jgi:hypothetical protein
MQYLTSGWHSIPHIIDSEEKSKQKRQEFLVAPQEFLPFVFTQTSSRTVV